MAGRLREALEASQRARAIFEEDPDLVSDRATALLLTALVQNARKGNEANEAALGLLEECMSAFAARNDSSGMLKALELRGIVLFDLRRYSEAVGTLQRALTEVSKLGDDRELARIENNIGRCALQAENYSEAMRYVQRAAFRFNELKMEAECARAWWCMARIHEALGRKTDALRELQRVEKEFRKLGMTSMAEQVSEDHTRLAGAA
jgi:tetratricopeptide (TPR) repeat protein